MGMETAMYLHFTRILQDLISFILALNRLLWRVMTRKQIRYVFRLFFDLLSETHGDIQNVPNWDRFTIVGTNKEIFKDYLRLTSVSEQSLVHCS